MVTTKPQNSPDKNDNNTHNNGHKVGNSNGNGKLIVAITVFLIIPSNTKALIMPIILQKKGGQNID